MAERIPREHYPWWVKFSLWGVPGREAAWAFVVLSIVAAAGSTAYAVTMGDRRAFVGILFLLAALIYWLSIRWVDRHGSWQRERS